MGHLFVIRGDLLQLRCNALALTGDVNRIGSRWTHPAADSLYEVPPDLRELIAPEASRRRAERCAHITRWRNIEVFRLDTGGVSDTENRWYIEGALAYLKAVKEFPWAATVKRPVAALPWIGAGRGRANPTAIARELVPALVAGAREHDLDVVLVTAEDTWFAAAQMARSRMESAFDDLPPELDLAAIDVARTFDSEDKPVLFVGAGISMQAGLPGWTKLLVDLASFPEGPDRDEFETLARTDALAAADVVARRLGGGTTLSTLVEQKLAGDPASRMPGLGHMLLASLPAEGFVTTNFDSLLENALRSTRIPIRIVPSEQPELGVRWVIKLHGTVGEPSLVLTRGTFLRFDTKSRSLLSLLEATILLRHLVVVGFSFTDPNFLRAIDGARQVLKQSRGMRDKRQLFTGLVVGRKDRFRQDVWPDANFVDFGEPPDGGRLQLIFLDRVNSLVETQAHFLDERFRALLTEQEQTLASSIQALKRALPATGHGALRRALERYARDEPHER
jgi:hypothetical protein